jgi:DNA repair protein RecO (recombination protein O)
MLFHTQGIVIKYSKFSETSVIARIFTRHHGMVSFMVNGVRTKKPSIKASLLQPLTLLDMVVYHKQNANFQRIKELKPIQVFSSIPFDLKKSAVALFTAEVLYRTIKEEEANDHLFSFLQQSVLTLENTTNSVANFPLFFLVQLSACLGFFPQDNYSAGTPYFNLREGVFEAAAKAGHENMEIPESELLSHICKVTLEDFHTMQISIKHRRKIVEKILQYYRLHVENFNLLNSYIVLTELFRQE